MKPLVSILIPAYNSVEWIGDTLRSAIAQTWKPKEIIVLDDGSTDRTLDVAKQFESKGVQVFTQANQGAAATRNAAFKLSHGDYIQWLDADDLLSPDKIARQMSVMEQLGNNRTLVSCGWGKFLYRYHRAKFVPTALWCDLSVTEWLVRKMEQNLHMQTATWLVSRELTEAAGPWDIQLLGDDDGEYFCRVLLKSAGVRFVPDAKVYYRVSGANSLSYIGKSDRKREAQWRSMKMHMDYLRSLEDSPRVHKTCVKYMQNWLTSFYLDRPDLISEMQQVADTFGNTLQIPRLPWKYSWIETLFGTKAGRRAQGMLPQLKWSLLNACDKILFQLESHNVSTVSAS